MILASRSPRRKELLASCGVEFSIYDAAVKELTADCGVPIEQLPVQNALLKAQCVADRFPDELVLGADTMVICDGKALGKPGSLEESFRMLEMLSGKSHEVVTGVALVWKKKNFSEIWSGVSHVKFKHLSNEDIKEYTSLVNTLDKAGAYAVQEHGELIIDHFDGELENIIGLPLIRLKQLLDELLQK